MERESTRPALRMKYSSSVYSRAVRLTRRVRRRIERAREGRFAVGRDVHGVPFLLEPLADEARDLPVVLDHEDAHESQLTSARPSVSIRPSGVAVLSSRDVLARGAPVPDLTELFQHIGYGAIFVVVLLGNAGVPAPEES